MYHIKKDKRAIRSAELVQKGLVQCLKKKDFSEITVSDIQRESSVSRATFYRLFDNLIDVLYYQCDMLATTMEENYTNQTSATFTGFIQYSLSFWFDNHDFLEALFKSNNIYILQAVMTDHSHFFKGFFSENKIPEAEIAYLIPIATSMLSSILMTWIKNGKKESLEDIYKLLEGVVTHMEYCMRAV